MNPANRRVEHVIGTIGVLYNLFIAGVRVDPAAILQFGKRKPVIIGLASIFMPTAIGFIFYVFKRNQLDLLDADNKKLVFLVLYPLCTTYPIAVHEILQELGLLNSELGRLALSSSLLQGSIGWTCVLAHVVIKQGKQNIRHGFIALLCCLAIICFIILIIRPYAMWIGRTTPPYARVREVHILVITTLVLVMGFLSDIVGSTTYIDAPVMMGMAIPDGPPLGTALTERVDLVATEVLLPLIFMPEGFYMEWEEIKQKLSSTLWVGLLVLVTCITKIAACTAGAIFCQMPLKSGLLLGFMMNFRGLSDMLVFLSLTNAKAQCSVGIMVYHGHNTTRITRHSNRQYQVGVLFFGGPDDREALAVASRMACHPDVRLNVVRFLPSDCTADQNADYDHTYQKVSDDMMISELQAANAGNDRVTVSEIRVRNMELVVSMIKDMEDNNYDLLIVGRRYETNLSEPDDDLVEWTESPELGVIGDLLATDISGIQNVLIVQQHTATEK
ncbi:hypothetical protein LUZ60_016148 [Juncus effusus]|nr:hypothetical protein LUZ60_016148 [Juncus effusus]